MRVWNSTSETMLVRRHARVTIPGRLRARAFAGISALTTRSEPMFATRLRADPLGLKGSRRRGSLAPRRRCWGRRSTTAATITYAGLLRLLPFQPTPTSSPWKRSSSQPIAENHALRVRDAARQRPRRPHWGVPGRARDAAAPGRCRTPARAASLKLVPYRVQLVARVGSMTRRPPMRPVTQALPIARMHEPSSMLGRAFASARDRSAWSASCRQR